MRVWTTAGIVVAVVAAPAAAVAAAQNGDASELVRELSRLERRAGDASVGAREREAAVDRAIEVRARLIERAGGAAGGGGADAGRAAVWRAAQAAAVLGRLARDGSDSAAMFGLPTPAQRRAAREAATLAMEMVERAEGPARAELERLGGPGAEASAEMEEVVGVRAPFLRARAAAVLAGVSEGEERRRWAGVAVAQGSKLALVNPAAEAARRVTVAAGMLLRSTPVSDEDARSAAEEAGWVVTSGGAGVSAATVGEAWLALVRAAAARGDVGPVRERAEAALKAPPLVSAEGRVDALAAALLADAVTVGVWERGVATRAPALLAEAAAAQTGLAQRTDLTVRGESLAPLVNEKLAGLAERDRAGMALPPAVRLARAVAMARSAERRGEALGELVALAEDASAGSWAPEALWERAVILLSPAGGGGVSREDRGRAVAALTGLARGWPGHARAAEALTAALRHGRALAADEEGDESARVAYLEALRLACARAEGMAEIDLWRYERARLAARELVEGRGVEEGELLAATRGLREIAEPPGTSAVSSADVVRLGEALMTRVVEKLGERVRTARAAGDGAGVRAAARVLADEAGADAAWVRARQGAGAGDETGARMGLAAAEARIEMGEGAAVVEPLRGLMAVAGGVPGGRPRVELALGRALLAAGEEAEGVAMVRAAAEGADVEGRRGEVFWEGWSILLERLAGEAGREGAVRAHLRRLEGIDAGLGGEPWAGRLRGVRGKVGEGE